MRARKIIALILSLVMVFAMSAVALADDASLNDQGEAGAFEEPDQVTQQGKNLLIQKAIKVYNPDSLEVYAPTITYTYTIEPFATDGSSVTDDPSNHASGNAVTAEVKPGVALENDTATVEFNTTMNLTSQNDGELCLSNFAFDFSDVDFGQPGVYRYKITESVNGVSPDDADALAAAYAASGVTPADDHERFLDVYVKADGNYNPDEDSADNWMIYGYTCFYYEVENLNPGNKEEEAIKTPGFVEKPIRGVGVDTYYTYNLSVSKTVNGDAYASKKFLFPFTIALTNDAITNEVRIYTDSTPDSEAENVTGFSGDISGLFSEGDFSGDLLIRDGYTVTYIGIPCGTDVSFYETNPVPGATYTVTTEYTGADEAQVDYGVVENATSTAVTIETDADAVSDALTIDVTNALETISPTGIILRYGPYMLMLAGGILLLVLAIKLRRRSKSDEEVA